MKSVDIFVHSVRQVFGNLPEALRISGVLFGVQAAAGLAIGPLDPAAMGTGEVSIVGLLLVLVITLVTSLWIAVAWHRYVLLQEQPGALVPAFRGDRVAGYFGYSLVIALILIPVAMGLALAIGLVAAPFMTAEPSMGAAILVGLLVYVPLVMIGYRLSVVLPAAALGEPLGLGEAWATTRGETGVMLGLAVISVACAIAIQVPVMFLLGDGPLAMVWQVAAQWVAVMVGASILTTLYGHYVQKRALL